jgi:hypothetical protein
MDDPLCEAVAQAAQLVETIINYDRNLRKSDGSNQD